jgi:hypothetical protein
VDIVPPFTRDPAPLAITVKGIRQIHSLQLRGNEVVARPLPCANCSFDEFCAKCLLLSGFSKFENSVTSSMASVDAPDSDPVADAVVFSDEEGENSDLDNDSSDSETSSSDESESEEGMIALAPFSAAQFWPAQVVKLTEVPLHNRKAFSKLSPLHCIVKWLGEERFTAVKRSRIVPVSQTEMDRQRAARNPEVFRRYQIALDMIKTD